MSTETQCKNCTPQKQKTLAPTGLIDYSPKDSKWDKNRAYTEDVGMIYAGAQEFERYAKRMSDCSGLLSFGWADDTETGESQLRLRHAAFCRVRYCPVCQWRRTMMWHARFYQKVPELIKEHPKARWLFLTLTVENCPITELRTTLSHMNKSFQRLKDRKEFKIVKGWVRTTEVTRSEDGKAHPHFHCLLMVPPSYFKGQNYVKQLRWAEIWGECLRADYLPNIDIRTVKAAKLEEGASKEEETEIGFQRAVVETLKYSTKFRDMTDDPEWFLELTRQTHKLRFVATGGALKDVLRVEDETNEDLIMADGQTEDETGESRIAFGWRSSDRQYKRTPNADRIHRK